MFKQIIAESVQQNIQDSREQQDICFKSTDMNQQNQEEGSHMKTARQPIRGYP